MASCLVPDPCSEYRSGITNYFRTKKDDYLVLRGGYYNVVIIANFIYFSGSVKNQSNPDPDPFSDFRLDPDQKNCPTYNC